MNPSPAGSRPSFRGIKSLLGFSILILSVASLCPSPAEGDAPSDPRLPKVLMLEIPDVTPKDPGLYQAISAQLSAAPLILDREILPEGDNFSADPLAGAAAAAAESRAAMVFWIEDDESCRLLFYIPDPKGGRINSRTLALDLNSSWSRFQTIALAAASMVEGLLVRHDIRPVPPPKKVPPPTPEPPTAPQIEEHRFEISAAYTGSLFAPSTVTHGGTLAIAVRPTPHLAIGASFTQGVPIIARTTEQYELTLVSRFVELSIAGRFHTRAVEVRLGAAWWIDLRSETARFSPGDVTAAPDTFHGYNHLMPFASLEWKFSERIGLFGRLGASFAVNEAAYMIDQLDGDDTEILLPLLVKLSYQLGLIIKI